MSMNSSEFREQCPKSVSKERNSCSKIKYRALNKSSSVDGLLFGDKGKLVDVLEEKKKEIPKKTEVIQVITKDMIRKLRVRNEDPSGCTIVLSSDEFNRIRNAARVLTKQEKQALYEQQKLEKRKLQEDADMRKNVMQKLEVDRRCNEKISDIEQEAKERSQYLLGKAIEQIEEEDDEIKKLNEVILNAKCHAIRDAQLIEKVEMKKEMAEEEKRLDVMMESDRLRALVEYEDRENLKRMQRLKGAHLLHQQIEENEQQSLLEQEKKDHETKAMLQYLEKLQKEDMDALMKKRENQKAIQCDVAKAHQEIKLIKERQKEFEHLEEQKVTEYLKEKKTREEMFELEKKILQVEREKEIARLRMQQEHAKDKQAEKEALRAKRNQEETDREWRKREKENAIKKSEAEKNLRLARQEQIANRDHFLAVQAARDRAEFERVFNAQRLQANKDEQANRDFCQKQALYAEDVRHQIKEKEKQRIQERQSFFQDGIKLDNEAKERRQKLDEIKRRKLKELKEAGVPDKYVMEVARRIEGPSLSLSNVQIRMEERTDLGDASAIWKFLDNMYVSNPAAYKNFIDNVLKEGKDQKMGPPMAHIAIQTVRVPPVIPPRKYFINVVKWIQVPKPENNHSSVPMVISEQRKELVDQEWAILIDIAVNPFLFNENAPLNMDVSELLQVALLYVESKFSLKLSKKYTILDKKYIGNEDNLLNLMCPSSLKDSLKNSYNSNSLNENVFWSSNNESNQNITKSNGSMSPQQVDHSFALHEISSKVTRQKCSIKKVRQTPRAEMNVDKESMNIFVTIQLPGVQGVAECILELTQRDLLLSVSDKYELQLDLPLNIDVNSSKAKFVRDEQVLLITAPFQTS